MLGTCPEPRLATLADFRASNGLTLDQGIALYFTAPNSFTGEDVLELQGHGGPVLLSMILSCALELGARLAEPGEFSKRAFLNDKLDLAQAESIADLINSGTRQAAVAAMRSFQGYFSDQIIEIVAEVTRVRVYIEAAIDFSEDEIDFLDDEKLRAELGDIQTKFVEVLREVEAGTLLSEGATVVLLGKPNAGKSTLMNQFTGRETSIVTHLAGTTRDIIEEQLQIEGVPLRFIDTAGIRESDDVIEVEGIRRAMMAAERADLAIIIVDASAESPETDLRELMAFSGLETIALYNKVDLVDTVSLPEGVLSVSAKTGSGMEQLRSAIKAKLGIEAGFGSGFTARTRHISALKAAQDALERGLIQFETNKAGELLAEELKHCQACLSEITGEYTADDLLGEIFSSFCIGK